MRKILIIILTLLLVGLIVYLNRPRPEQYFKTTPLSTNNSIYNETDMDFMDTIVSVGLSELKLNDIEVEIRPMDIMVQDKFNTDNANNTLKAFIVQLSENNYMVYSGRLTREEALTMLSHELIHLKQYYTKKLILEKDKVYWDGEEMYQTEINEIESFLGKRKPEKDKYGIISNKKIYISKLIPMLTILVARYKGHIIRCIIARENFLFYS